MIGCGSSQGPTFVRMVLQYNIPLLGLEQNTLKLSILFNLKMPDQADQLSLPLLEVLQQWIILNVEFHIFLYYTPGCQHALAPGSISRHLRDKHQVKREVQKQADQYFKQWQWQHDFCSVPLPLDGSLPQRVLPVFNGFQCYDYNFKT